MKTIKTKVKEFEDHFTRLFMLYSSVHIVKFDIWYKQNHFTDMCIRNLHGKMTENRNKYLRNAKQCYLLSVYHGYVWMILHDKESNRYCLRFYFLFNSNDRTLAKQKAHDICHYWNIYIGNGAILPIAHSGWDNISKQEDFEMIKKQVMDDVSRSVDIHTQWISKLNVKTIKVFGHNR